MIVEGKYPRSRNRWADATEVGETDGVEEVGEVAAGHNGVGEDGGGCEARGVETGEVVGDEEREEGWWSSG